MNRRNFLAGALAATGITPLLADLEQGQLDEAASVLARATASGQVSAAVLHVKQRGESFTRAFGKGTAENAMFLLGSISKPVCVTALMSLYDNGEFKLDDSLQKFIPAFKGDGREKITIQQLLTHVSGLPDQLPENNALRSSHAPLSAFVAHAIKTPLSFAPGSKYQYSSMGILLATHVAERISGTDILALVGKAVLGPLKMDRSAQGLGRFKLDDFVPCQSEYGSPEAGAGDPRAKEWDWNSPYWRKLGVPWGGTHCSAADVGRFLDELLHERGAAVKPETARLMVSNHNPPGLAPRGLGLNVGAGAGSKGCSERTFGHTGSTGTICWADPATETICVVLTTLPGRAVTPHPRDVAAAHVAAAAK